MEESKSNTSLLSTKKTHPTILLLHPLLHHSPNDHVHTRSHPPVANHMLHTRHHVVSQHPPVTKIFPFIVPYLLFENTMSVTKFNAMISGLFHLGNAYEWVVTKKSGRASEGDLMSLIQIDQKRDPRGVSEPDLEKKIKEEEMRSYGKKKYNMVYTKELMLAFLLLAAAGRSVLAAQGIHFYFLLFQGIAFFLVGLDLIGEQVE
ncbi:hypothetical protein E3N88_44761 [Mikania micrantha]|uniref:Uncharacterized protein n=1 Tax=Mikania micrantha TaxID=192012 RepID=A0A5N6LB50_9ASTR|nr:hypothetical protein E3N88_44761 [Mikania micrantha]